MQGTGDQFRTTGAVVIGSGGTVTTTMESVEYGPIPAPIGQLVNVATAVLGWETVTNPSSAALGRLEESDISARRRRYQTLALQGRSLSESIQSRVNDLKDVRSTAFRENVANTTETIDGIVMVPHSVYVAVDGGLDNEIAEALLASKSDGTGS